MPRARLVIAPTPTSRSEEDSKSTGERRAKMRAPLLLLGGIVVLSLAVARALSCVCSPLECDVLTNEDCPGGLIWDPCRYAFTRERATWSGSLNPFAFASIPSLGGISADVKREKKTADTQRANVPRARSGLRLLLTR